MRRSGRSTVLGMTSPRTGYEVAEEYVWYRSALQWTCAGSTRAPFATEGPLCASTISAADPSGTLVVPPPHTGP